MSGFATFFVSAWAHEDSLGFFWRTFYRLNNDSWKCITHGPRLLCKRLCCDWWFLPGDAEEVDVPIVDGEVKEHSSGASVQPQVVFERLQLDRWPFFCTRQILVVSSTSIFRHLTPITGPVHLALCCIHPPKRHQKEKTEDVDIC